MKTDNKRPAKLLFLIIMILLPSGVFALDKKSYWLLEIGYPLAFRNEIIPENLNPKPVAVFDQNILLGFSSLKRTFFNSRFSLGGSTIFIIAPLEKFNIKPVTNEEEPKISFLISGPAIQFNFWNSDFGPVVSVSGGPAMLDLGEGSSPVKEQYTRYYGGGLTIGGGYNFQLFEKQALLLNFRLTWVGAFLPTEDSWCSFTIITLSFGFRV
jgi:hypothetical protein